MGTPPTPAACCFFPMISPLLPYAAEAPIPTLSDLQQPREANTCDDNDASPATLSRGLPGAVLGAGTAVAAGQERQQALQTQPHTSALRSSRPSSPGCSLCWPGASAVGTCTSAHTASTRTPSPHLEVVVSAGLALGHAAVVGEGHVAGINHVLNQGGPVIWTGGGSQREEDRWAAGRWQLG